MLADPCSQLDDGQAISIIKNEYLHFSWISKQRKADERTRPGVDVEISVSNIMKHALLLYRADTEQFTDDGTKRHYNTLHNFH